MFRLMRILTVVFALVGIFQETSAAQNVRAGTKAIQAVLTIQVQVVPTAMLPAQQASPSNQSISYSIPLAPVRLSVTEKKQLINVADPTGKVEPYSVNVVTVVPQ
jgi:hypothetical protein